MANGRFRQLLIILAVILIIGMAFVWLVDLQAVGQQLAAADWRWLVAASACLLAGLLAYAVRWRLLLHSQPSLRLTFHAANIGHAGNILIPARAGEAARIVVMGRSEAVSYTAATSSFVVERLFEQLMRLLALAGAVVFGVGLEPSVGTMVGGLGVLAATFVAVRGLTSRREAVLARWPVALARLPRLTEDGVRASLTDLLENLTAVSAPPQLARIMLWSLLPWVCFFGFFYLTLLALGNAFPPEQQLAVAFGALALSPPSAPTQPGIFHASVVAPLAAIGYNSAALTAFAVVLHILEMVWMIGLAVWGLLETGVGIGALKVDD